MSPLDWIVAAVFVGAFAALAIYLKRYTRSVADFLAANRCAGRYLLTVAEGASGVGAITLVAQFEVYYHAGFVPAFWMLMLLPSALIISLSGWVIYRYRQTRAMTLAQFFEMRYSRNFRVFAGAMGFLSGIINYGIFPAVTSRLFIHFLGMPDAFVFLGVEWSTYVVMMIGLLSAALVITLAGGQVVIMITDFLQGQLINIVLLVLLLYIALAVNWSDMAETLLAAPAGQSKVNPFDSGEVRDFNIWFYIIGLFGAFYGTMAWQGTQAYNASAKSAHEARMGKVLSQWRSAVTAILPLFLSTAAFVILNNSNYADIGASVSAQLEAIADPQTRTQLTTPLVIRALLPVGLMGLFVVVMLSAAISTDNTYLHSWGSIFIQDVVMPLRKKPLSPRAHLFLLRASILGVAVFAFFFSLLFRQTQYILLFFAITGSIFVGGAGSAIIGGLYWKRGTTAAAWSAMITGAVLSLGGVAIKQVNPDFFLNGQQMFFVAMVTSALVYIVVSLLGRQTFDLDRMLHRGAYAEPGVPEPTRGLRALRPGPEFTRGDRVLYYLTVGWSLSFFTAFVVITIWNLVSPLPDTWWMGFWRVFILIGLCKGIIVTVWFTIGGGLDLRDLLRTLRLARRDADDDGSVSHPPAKS